MTAQEAICKAAESYLPATYKRALTYLEHHPSDAVTLSDHLGMTLSSTYKLIGVLRELKVVCVVQWVRLSIKGEPIKIWGLGNKNTQRPRKKTPAERTRDYRQRKKVTDGSVRLGVWGL